MKELISASRIGRSLGVHLILATQKPSGQVNDQIWSNSRFKLCLKVQDQQDSNEVIKSPVAAEIKEPGRAYLQVGNNEIFELLQSGYSGGPAFRGGVEDKPFCIYNRNLTGRGEVFFKYVPNKKEAATETELEAIVKSYADQFETEDISRLPAICLPPLPEIIDFPDNIQRSASYECIAEIGIMDDPNNHRQVPTFINFSQDNIMMIGASQYGKTNMLQLIVRSLCTNYTPEEVNIYILDFGSMILRNFDSIKHVGGVVIPNEDEKFKNLMKLLLSEIEERKEKMLKAGVSSFSSYREAGYTDIPQIVFLIDNYTAVKEYYLQEEDPIMQICRDGISVGISTVIANAQTSGMGYRYMANFSKRIAFYCNESSEYSNIIEKCRTAPDNVAGRALTEINKQIYELQTYLSFPGEKEIERITAMRDFVEVVNTMSDGQAKRIPTIPDVLCLKDFNTSFKASDNLYAVPVGLNYDPIEPVEIDLINQGWFVINGRNGMGKRNIVHLICDHLYKNMFTCPAEIYIIDAFDRKLSQFENHGIVAGYSIDSADAVEYIDQTYSEICERYSRYVQGKLDLDEEPLKLLIIRSQEALEIISKNTTAIKEFNELTSKLKVMKVCFIFMDIPNSQIGYTAPELLKTIKDSKNMFYLDDLQNMKMFDVSVVTQRKYKKKLLSGDAYWLTGNEISKVKIIKREE